MNDQSPTENQQQEQAPSVADQGAFLNALGIDPNNVAPNSIKIEFAQNGMAIVSFTAVLGVTPQALGMAFMASGGMLGGGAGAPSEPVGEPGGDGNVTPLTKTGRRTAAKKTAAKKTAAKKTTEKKNTD